MAAVGRAQCTSVRSAIFPRCSTKSNGRPASPPPYPLCHDVHTRCATAAGRGNGATNHAARHRSTVDGRNGVRRAREDRSTNIHQTDDGDIHWNSITAQPSTPTAGRSVAADSLPHRFHRSAPSREVPRSHGRSAAELRPGRRNAGATTGPGIGWTQTLKYVISDRVACSRLLRKLSSILAGTGGSGIWRSDSAHVVRLGIGQPERIAKCNARQLVLFR